MTSDFLQFRDMQSHLSGWVFTRAINWVVRPVVCTTSGMRGMPTRDVAGSRREGRREEVIKSNPSETNYCNVPMFQCLRDTSVLNLRRSYFGAFFFLFCFPLGDPLQGGCGGDGEKEEEGKKGGHWRKSVLICWGR